MKIENLRLTYKNGFKAVQGINVKMYEDQIFVLLGHNGAGKTSTISMLTGLLNPSQGDVQVYGLNLLKEIPEVRKIMGVCPQYDVLFEHLTVQEHLEFYYEMKGANPDKKARAEDINTLMKDLGV